MIDVYGIPVPDAHIWAVVTAWVAAYIGGRWLAALS